MSRPTSRRSNYSRRMAAEAHVEMPTDASENKTTAKKSSPRKRTTVQKENDQ